MSKQTALQKAIEQLSQYRDSHNNMREANMIDICIDKLTDLLPYDREVIENAYEIGGINSKAKSIYGFSEYKNKTDYFTKTFTAQP